MQDLIAPLAGTLGPLGVLVVAVVYLLLRRRNGRSASPANYSNYVTKSEFQTAVTESRDLLTTISEQAVGQLSGQIEGFATEARQDRQNLYDHVADHVIHGSHE